MKNLTQYKGLVWYGFLFLGITAGILFEATFFYSKIKSLTDKETLLAAQVKNLENRKDTLEGLSDEILSKSNKILTIFPSVNSSLLVASQVKNAAVENSVTLKSITINTFPNGTDEAYQSAQVGVVAEGETLPLLNFLTSLRDYAPIMSLQNVNLVGANNIMTAQATIFSFWAPLPKNLPAITEPIQALSPEEITLLNDVNLYKLPIFGDVDEGDISTGVNSEPFTIR